MVPQWHVVHAQSSRMSCYAHARFATSSRKYLGHTYCNHATAIVGHCSHCSAAATPLIPHGNCTYGGVCMWWWWGGRITRAPTRCWPTTNIGNPCMHGVHFTCLLVYAQCTTAAPPPSCCSADWHRAHHLLERKVGPLRMDWYKHVLCAGSMCCAHKLPPISMRMFTCVWPTRSPLVHLDYRAAARRRCTHAH